VVAGDNSTISSANITSLTINPADISIQLDTGKATVTVSKFDIALTVFPQDSSASSFGVTAPSSNFSFVLKLYQTDGLLYFRLSAMKVNLPNFQLVDSGNFLGNAPDVAQVKSALQPGINKWFLLRTAATFNSFQPYQTVNLPVASHLFLIDYTNNANPTIASDHITIPTVGAAHLPGYTFNLPSTILLPELDVNSTQGLQFHFSAFSISSAIFSSWAEAYFNNLINLTNSSVTSANLTAPPVFDFENGTLSATVPGILLINGSKPDLRVSCQNRNLLWAINVTTSRWVTNASVACTVDYWSGSSWINVVNMNATANMTLKFSVVNNNALRIFNEYTGGANSYTYMSTYNTADIKNQMDRLFGSLFKNTPINIPLPILPGLKLTSPTVALNVGYISVGGTAAVGPL
jgi:hypothetical protein